jgi:hypothetical protein
LRLQLFDQVGQGQGFVAAQVLAEPGASRRVAVFGLFHGLGDDLLPVLEAHGGHRGAEVFPLGLPPWPPRAAGPAEGKLTLDRAFRSHFRAV